MELALGLPVIVILGLLLIQVALLARDEVAVVHAAREAARAASVDPDPARAEAAAQHVLPGARVELGPRPDVGGELTVTVTDRSRTDVPLVGPMLADPELRASVTIRVER
ncbi:MAG: TadE-like protein [Actinomycetia bacterium]|nr:TadE-like protein [Actinomycetes bacterium]